MQVAGCAPCSWAHRSHVPRPLTCGAPACRDSPGSHNTLHAFDLQLGRLLWARQVPTAGLLNTVGAPHLGHDSTYRAVYTPVRMYIAPRLPDSDATVAGIMRDLEGLGFPAQVGAAGCGWGPGGPGVPCPGGGCWVGLPWVPQGFPTQGPWGHHNPGGRRRGRGAPITLLVVIKPANP